MFEKALTGFIIGASAAGVIAFLVFGEFFEAAVISLLLAIRIKQETTNA